VRRKGKRIGVLWATTAFEFSIFADVFSVVNRIKRGPSEVGGIGGSSVPDRYSPGCLHSGDLPVFHQALYCSHGRLGGAVSTDSHGW